MCWQKNSTKRKISNGGKSEKTCPKWASFHKNTPNMPLAVNWNSKSAIKFEKSNPQKRNLLKTSQKTTKFQLKQVQKQATRKSSKKTQLHKKISPNSREKRKVGNTAIITDAWNLQRAPKSKENLYRSAPDIRDDHGAGVDSAGVCILGWSRSRSQYFKFEPEQEPKPGQH